MTPATNLSTDYYADMPSSKLPNLTGRYIGAGRYKLVEKIGQGSFGIVYLGQDVRTNPRKYVAVKNTVEGRNTSIRREIELQARAGAATSGVLAIHEIVDDEDWDLTFIVTDYCPGGDLFDLIHTKEGKRRFRDEEQVRSTFLQILDAVATCHENGIYHRDLKPENVLCMDDGDRVVLTDFGFATTEPFTEQFGMGTEGYMSPEVHGGLHVHLRGYSSPHADTWALGVILFNLITIGKFPWKTAKMCDSEFFHYIMHAPDFLMHAFAVSEECNVLLKGIFTANPRNRFSIEEIRLRVKTMKHFRAPRVRFGASSSKARNVKVVEVPYEGKGKGVDRRAGPSLHTLLNTPIIHTRPVSFSESSDSEPASSMASVSFEALMEDDNGIVVGSQQWPSDVSAHDGMMSAFLGGDDIDSITRVETLPRPPAPFPARAPLTVRNPSPPSSDSDSSSVYESDSEDDEAEDEAITPETHAVPAAGSVPQLDLDQPATAPDQPLLLTIPAAKLPRAAPALGAFDFDIAARTDGTYSASQNMLMIAARRMRMRREKMAGIVATKV